MASAPLSTYLHNLDRVPGRDKPWVTAIDLFLNLLHTGQIMYR